MLTGEIVKRRGPFWSADVAAIHLYTQGTSVADAVSMIKDAIEGLVDQPGFEVTVTEVRVEPDRVLVEITANQPELLVNCNSNH